MTVSCRVAVLLCLVLATGARAERAPAEWLEAMTTALDTSVYQGRLLYLRGDQISTLQVRQLVDGQTRYERITHLDSHAAELIRVGPDVVSLHADGSVTRLPAGDELASLGLKSRLSAQVPAEYQLQLAGNGRVAGRETTRLHLVPVDSFRFGYRLWLDNDSALPLKVETVDAQGQPLERMEFVSLDLDAGLTLDDFALPDLSAEQALAPAPAQQHAGRTVELEATWLPPGFRLVEGDTRLAQSRPVTARTYSDGIATFTLFVEPGAAQADRPLVSRLGPTLAVTSHVQVMDAGFNVTLLGEVPPATAEKVLASLKLVLESPGG